MKESFEKSEWNFELTLPLLGGSINKFGRSNEYLLEIIRIYRMAWLLPAFCSCAELAKPRHVVMRPAWSWPPVVRQPVAIVSSPQINPVTAKQGKHSATNIVPGATVYGAFSGKKKRRRRRARHPQGTGGEPLLPVPVESLAVGQSQFTG